MGYDGYARFWFIFGAVSIGCNLWILDPDLVRQDVVMESQVHIHKPWRSSMAGRSDPYWIILLTLLVYPILFPSHLWGQQKSQEMPPASVSVAKVMRGQVAPQSEFIATIFYQEISDTASEISGLVGTVHFEEGQRVKKKQILVELGSEILRKRLQATTAS